MRAVGKQTGDPAIATEGQGMFVVAPPPNVGAESAGCTTATATAMPPLGVFIEVSSALAMTSGACFMSFRALTQDTGIGGQLVLQYGKLGLSDPMVGVDVIDPPYDPVAMRWWRLRPIAGGIVGEVSRDGVSWQVLGTIQGTPAAQVTIDFTAACGIANPAPGMAVFQSFDLCP